MATRDRILDVAQALVQSIGVNAMSYQHISDAIEIRKASIHHHFPTKENLIEALIERYSDYFLTLVDRIMGSNKSGAAKLRDYASLYEGTLREGAHDKACMMGMLGAEVRTLGQVAAERVRQFYAQNERRLTQILESGRSDGSLAFAGSAEALAAVVFALLEGGMLVARGRNDPGHLQMAVEQLFRLIEK